MEEEPPFLCAHHTVQVLVILDVQSAASLDWVSLGSRQVSSIRLLSSGGSVPPQSKGGVLNACVAIFCEPLLFNSLIGKYNAMQK